MSGPADHDRSLPKPFLIEADGEGAFRLTLRQGRFNSQNYPVVTATVIEERFATAAAARAYAKTHYAATTGEFSVPPRKAK
jgi:hypothetical protein